MRKWDRTLCLGPGFPLPPCPRHLWRRLVQAAQPRRLVPKHLPGPLPPQPRTGAPPATRKGSTKEQQCFSQGCERQLSPPLSPHHLRSPVISASNPPPSDRTGSAGRMGRVPAAQLWALLSPLRRLAGIFQNGQKTPFP